MSTSRKKEALEARQKPSHTTCKASQPQPRPSRRMQPASRAVRKTFRARRNEATPGPESVTRVPGSVAQAAETVTAGADSVTAIADSVTPRADSVTPPQNMQLEALHSPWPTFQRRRTAERSRSPKLQDQISPRPPVQSRPPRRRRPPAPTRRNRPTLSKHTLHRRGPTIRRRRQPCKRDQKRGGIISQGSVEVPLSASARRFLEPIVGIDPASVNVYQAPHGAAATRGADAVTVGNDVVLAAGQAGESPRALGLLAHELTHVAHERAAQANAEGMPPAPQPPGVAASSVPAAAPATAGAPAPRRTPKRPRRPRRRSKRRSQARQATTFKRAPLRPSGMSSRRRPLAPCPTHSAPSPPLQTDTQHHARSRRRQRSPALASVRPRPDQSTTTRAAATMTSNRKPPRGGWSRG